jgi:membrane protease YdiL (CAAX protease family)
MRLMTAGGERAPDSRQSLVRRALISRHELRLRAFWRLAIHTVMAVLAVSALGVVGVILAVGFGLRAAAPWAQPYAAVWVAAGVTVATWAARRLVDRRSFVSLGLAGRAVAWRDLAVGLLLGAAMVGVLFLVLAALGMVTAIAWAGATTPMEELVPAVLGEVVLFCLVGYYEELISRGYHFVNLADGLSQGWAVVLTSASFGILHLANPGAGPASLVGIVVAGLVFAYARLRTGLLWMPIGVHIGWNLALGLLGFPVSGIDVPALLSPRVTGPTWATGGAFGPEASVLAPLVLGLGALTIHAYTRNRSRLERV